MTTRVEQSRRLGLTRGLAIQALLGLLVTLTAVGFGQAPAAAAPAPAVAVAQQAQPAMAPVTVGQSPQQALGSFSCTWTKSGNRVDSTCKVSGLHLRQWAYCAGWGYIYTAWVGPTGTYHLWTNCGGYTLTSWGYQYY